MQAGSSAAVPAGALHSLPTGEKTPHFQSKVFFNTLLTRFARMCTGRSPRGLAGRCQRRPVEVVLVEAVVFLIGKPAVGVVAATARDQAATNLCSQGLLVLTRGQMLRPPLKPGQAAMPSTLVELVKSFNLLEIYLTEMS